MNYVDTWKYPLCGYIPGALAQTTAWPNITLAREPNGSEGDPEYIFFTLNICIPRNFCLRHVSLKKLDLVFKYIDGNSHTDGQMGRQSWKLK